MLEIWEDKTDGIKVEFMVKESHWENKVMEIDDVNIEDLNNFLENNFLTITKVDKNDILTVITNKDDDLKFSIKFSQTLPIKNTNNNQTTLYNRNLSNILKQTGAVPLYQIIKAYIKDELDCYDYEDLDGYESDEMRQNILNEDYDVIQDAYITDDDY